MSTTVHEAPCQPQYWWLQLSQAIPLTYCQLVRTKGSETLIGKKKSAILDLSVESYSWKYATTEKEKTLLIPQCEFIELNKTRVFNITGNESEHRVLNNVELQSWAAGTESDTVWECHCALRLHCFPSRDTDEALGSHKTQPNSFQPLHPAKIQFTGS